MLIDIISGAAFLLLPMAGGFLLRRSLRDSRRAWLATAVPALLTVVLFLLPAHGSELVGLAAGVNAALAAGSLIAGLIPGAAEK